MPLALKIAIPLIVVGGIAGWIFSLYNDKQDLAEKVENLTADKALLEQQLDTAINTAEENATAAKELQERLDRTVQAINVKVDRDAKRQEQANEQTKRIGEAPEDDDGPVAPVLRDTLGWVRDTAPAAAQGDNEGSEAAVPGSGDVPDPPK